MLEAAALQRRRSLVFAYCSEIVGPLLRVAARMRADGPPTPPATWRRVVILGSSHIGDVLYRTSSLAALRRAFPDAHITYACASDTRALLDTNPDIDAVLALDDDERSWPWSERVRSMFRAQRFDAALCTNHHVYHADLMLAAVSGIPNRVAFVHKGFSGLATVPIPGNFPRPSPMYFRSMVASLAGTAPDWPLDPVLHLTAQDRAEADAAMAEMALDEGRITVACTLTVRQQATLVWPAEQYLVALEALNRVMPLQVAFCGSQGDAALLHGVAARASFPSRVLAGRLGLRALGVFLSRCDGLLAADSGPRHIANAVRTPVVFIRSLSASRAESGQYSDNEIDLAPEGDFLPLAEQGVRLSRIDPLMVARTLADHIDP
ncbi:MAG TPA: glycosyltransferase family 9 protein [Gemmatimonadaceae bacterium]|jgi:ADP-heptose:LPS heptosyltransferase|nr:glycosyltransferase family 9 protein [Gemmatimonadaceae bacterium]